MAGEDFEVVGRVVVDDSGAASLQDINGRLSDMQGKAGGVGSAFSALGSVANYVWANVILSGVTRAASAMADFATGSIQKASDLNETINKTGAIFGDATDKIVSWSKSSATALGLSQGAALDAASMFGVFGKSAGLAGDELAKFAESNLGLASDLASFFNTSVEDAARAMQAAFRGETEPIRAYGVLLDDASMRQQALAMGIISTTKDALTPQQKVLAAQALILKQTSDAQGDFAKTSSGLANSQRIFSAQLENVQTQLGTAFLPIVNSIMVVLNTKFIPIIQEVVAVIGKWVSEASGKLGPMFQSLGASTLSFREILQTLSLWWQVNGPAIIVAGKKVWDALATAFDQLRAKILPFIQQVLGTFLKWFVENGPLIQKFITVIADAFTNYIIPAVVQMWNIIQPILMGLINIILDIGKFIMQVVTGDWQGAWNTAGLILNDVIVAINGALMGLFDTITALFQTNTKTVLKQWSDFLTGMKAYAAKSWAEGIAGWTKFFSDLGTLSRKWWSDGLAGWQSFFQGLLDNIRAWISNALAGWEAFFSGLREKIAAGWASIVASTQAALGSFLEAIRSAFSSVVDAVGESLSDVAGTIWDAVSDWVSTVYNAAGQFYSAGAALVDNIVAGLQSKWDTILKWLTEKIKALIDDLLSAIGLGGDDTGDDTPIPPAIRAMKTGGLGGMSLAGATIGGGGAGVTVHHHYYGPVYMSRDMQTSQDKLSTFRKA